MMVKIENQGHEESIEAIIVYKNINVASVVEQKFLCEFPSSKGIEEN